MVLIIQLLVIALVILSTILTISVPVTLASPGQWEKSKNLIYTSISIWVGLVIITSIVNSFIV
uniref:Photosystem II reaction center protein Z n=1 Tax=Lophocladia kuetzingii TaxID=675577 RepID=A0A1Z1MPI9_9FLOR|nr:photosystem II protein Z [Lophocladia kuetzingii]ARW67674.1 photosystem II protein Z [Lophocladia kuetzingii]